MALNTHNLQVCQCPKVWIIMHKAWTYIIDCNTYSFSLQFTHLYTKQNKLDIYNIPDHHFLYLESIVLLLFAFYDHSIVLYIAKSVLSKICMQKWLRWWKVQTTVNINEHSHVGNNYTHNFWIIPYIISQHAI